MKLAWDYVIIGTFLLGLLVPASFPASGQEPARTTSLGIVARQLKAQREKQKEKPVAVFTNDNLPSESSGGKENGKTLKSLKENEPSAGSGGASKSPSKERGEKYFRSKADKIRSQLEFHRRQLAVLQQQLGLTKMQYYPNPQKTLEQESTPAFQSDVDKLRSKIAETQKAIADDQKAMDNLQEELRRTGGDPGWMR